LKADYKAEQDISQGFTRNNNPLLEQISYPKSQGRTLQPRISNM